MHSAVVPWHGLRYPLWNCDFKLSALTPWRHETLISRCLNGDGLCAAPRHPSFGSACRDITGRLTTILTECGYSNTTAGHVIVREMRVMPCWTPLWLDFRLSWPDLVSLSVPLMTAVARARQVSLVSVLLASSSLRVSRTRKSVMSVTRRREGAVCPRRNLPLSTLSSRTSAAR